MEKNNSRLHNNENRPLVSIIMPAYNCASIIGNSIESVIAQTYEAWELIIVDDCSSDATERVVAEYMQRFPQKIFYKRLPKNEGPAVARDEAIKFSNGKYLAFLDCDDEWLPEKTEMQIAFMEENGYACSATAYEHINENGDSRFFVCFPPEKTDYNKMLYLSNPVGNSTLVYNQELLGRISVPNVKKRCDFALWLEILRRTDYCYGIQDVLVKYRVRSNSVSSNKMSLVKYHWQLYRNIEKCNIFMSVFYLLCWAFVKGTGIGLHREHISHLQSRKS